jgi:large subunit ribosomal protein L15
MAKNPTQNGATKTVKVRLVKGLRGTQARHRLSVKALGLNKLNTCANCRTARGARPDQHRVLPGSGRGVIREPWRILMRMNTLKPAKGARKDRVASVAASVPARQDCRPRPQGFSSPRTGKGKIKAGFEGGQMPLQRRLPKVGFRSKMAKDTAEVLLYQLEKLPSTPFDFAALRAAKLVPSTAKYAKIVKKGEITRKLTLQGVAATAGAKAAIEAAGGSVSE